jgi:hypothetical protein
MPEVLRVAVISPQSEILAVGRDLRPDLVARAFEAGADGFFDIGVIDGRPTASPAVGPPSATMSA